MPIFSHLFAQVAAAFWDFFFQLGHHRALVQVVAKLVNGKELATCRATYHLLRRLLCH